MINLNPVFVLVIITILAILAWHWDVEEAFGKIRGESLLKDYCKEGKEQDCIDSIRREYKRRSNYKFYAIINILLAGLVLL